MTLNSGASGAVGTIASEEYDCEGNFALISARHKEVNALTLFYDPEYCDENGIWKLTLTSDNQIDYTLNYSDKKKGFKKGIFRRAA